MKNTDNLKSLSLGAATISTGIMYRNPVPHVVSRHGYFPSVVALDNGNMVGSVVIGEAFEAANLQTHIVHSADGGETWSEPVPLVARDRHAMISDCARLAVFPDGELATMMVQSHRAAHPGAGLANPENMGFVPTDLSVIRSSDYGNSWEAPEPVEPPLEGPSFEACSAIVPLRDGRWIWPTSTWRGWDGYAPNGMKMVALVSHDRGRSWPEYMKIMDGNEQKIIYWEGKVVEMQDGALLSVAWAYDEKNGKDLPNHYALSPDGGKTWSAPRSTGIRGQTLSILRMAGERFLTVFRRMDKPGLWMNSVRLDGDRWINEDERCLWGGEVGALTHRSDNMVQDFNELKFGAPVITRLGDGAVYIAFWCYERMVSNIRWFKIGL